MTFNFITPMQKVVATLSIPLSLRFFAYSLLFALTKTIAQFSSSLYNFFRSLIKKFADSFMSVKLLRVKKKFPSNIQCSLLYIEFRIYALQKNLQQQEYCLVFKFRTIYLCHFSSFFSVQFQKIDFMSEKWYESSKTERVVQNITSMYVFRRLFELVKLKIKPKKNHLC